MFSISTLQCMGERASPWQDYSPCVTFREKLGQKSLETCRVFFFFDGCICAVKLLETQAGTSIADKR